MPLPEMIRIDEQDWEKRRALLADGWREIEVLETYEGPAKSAERDEIDADGMREPEKEDHPHLVALAMTGFKYDRLHFDKEVDPAVADAAKVIGIVNALEQHDGEKFVAVHGSPPDAFLVCSMDDDNSVLVVDLVAVSASSQRRGIASKMIGALGSVIAPRVIRAGTQMHNEPAKKLYESLGMSVVSRQRTFHRP
jgi:ribosomal protein S18 acetylase RimI-like enzyme